MTILGCNATCVLYIRGGGKDRVKLANIRNTFNAMWHRALQAGENITSKKKCDKQIFQEGLEMRHATVLCRNVPEQTSSFRLFERYFIKYRECQNSPNTISLHEQRTRNLHF
jgi:hypothetical protein